MTEEKTIKYVIRTKQQIVDAMAIGNIIISSKVTSNPQFRDTSPNEPLGFKLVEGSDFEVVEFYDIKNDDSNFQKVFFGME